MHRDNGQGLLKARAWGGTTQRDRHLWVTGGEIYDGASFKPQYRFKGMTFTIAWKPSHTLTAAETQLRALVYVTSHLQCTVMVLIPHSSHCNDLILSR